MSRRLWWWCFLGGPISAAFGYSILRGTDWDGLGQVLFVGGILTFMFGAWMPLGASVITLFQPTRSEDSPFPHLLWRLAIKPKRSKPESDKNDLCV